MDSLLPLAKKVGEKLKARKETVGVSGSSAGGLISAVLLAVPGASAYFMGGAVVYTRPAGEAFLTATKEKRAGIRSSSEPWATLAAELVRERLNTTWGLAETGASGPTGNSYGDPAGHTCVAVVGPKGKIARTLRTGSNDRVANMRAFAAEALKLMDEQLSSPAATFRPVGEGFRSFRYRRLLGRRQPKDAVSTGVWGLSHFRYPFGDSSPFASSDSFRHAENRRKISRGVGRNEHGAEDLTSERRPSYSTTLLRNVKPNRRRGFEIGILRAVGGHEICALTRRSLLRSG